MKRLACFFLAVTWLSAGSLLRAQEGVSGGYLGIKVVENATTLEDIGDHKGVRVESVVENSPAQAAGIKVGDVIESLDGRSFDWPDQFHAAVDALKPGAAVKMEILREDVGFAVTVVPARRAAPRARKKILYLAETRRIGVRVRSLSREAALKAGLSPAEGVEVAGFRGKSPWERDGVKSGDILHMLEGRPLHDPREFIRRIRCMEEGKGVHLDIVRNGKRMRIHTVTSRKKRRTERVYIPVLFNYTSRTPEKSSWGVILDMFQTEWKKGKRTTTLFWIINWTTGESNELEEIQIPDEDA